MIETEVTKFGIMFHLMDLGFNKIEIHFSGGGDSGDIELPVFHRATDDHNSLSEYKEIEARRALVNDEVLSHINDLANKILENDLQEDWYNNDGGGGDLFIHIPTGEWEIEGYINVTNTIPFAYDGSMEEDD